LYISCSKKTQNKMVVDTSTTYKVEGYLYSKNTDRPVVGRAIAISQTVRTYDIADPYTITDSNGFFLLHYTPSGQKNGLNIYPKYKDYSCIFSDISFITNIPKCQNIDLKKVYTSQFY